VSAVIACMHLKHDSCHNYVPMAVADATLICYLWGVDRGSRQPVTGRLATHPSYIHNSQDIDAVATDGVASIFVGLLV